MKLALAGINHRTAPVEVRERVAFRADELPHALQLLHQHPGQPEGLILSTCNRVEVTATLDDQTDSAATLCCFPCRQPRPFARDPSAPSISV